MLYSFDNGNMWNYNQGGGEGRSLITNTSKIISLELNYSEIALSEDFGQNWTVFNDNSSIFHDIYYIEQNNTAFVYSNNGVIYKNQNLSTLTTKQLELKKKINLYPNPTQDFLQIEIPKTIKINSIQLMDFSGKIIKCFPTDEKQLDVSSVTSGVYFIVVETSEGVISGRIVIE